MALASSVPTSRRHFSLNHEVVVIDPLDPYYDTRLKEHNLERCREAGGDRFTHADVSKAGELLDYEPTTSIREGVSEFIVWYRDNEDWYDPLVRSS